MAAPTLKCPACATVFVRPPGLDYLACPMCGKKMRLRHAAPEPDPCLSMPVAAAPAAPTVAASGLSGWPVAILAGTMGLAVFVMAALLLDARRDAGATREKLDAALLRQFTPQVVPLDQARSSGLEEMRTAFDRELETANRKTAEAEKRLLDMEGIVGRLAGVMTDLEKRLDDRNTESAAAGKEMERLRVDVEAAVTAARDLARQQEEARKQDEARRREEAKIQEEIRNRLLAAAAAPTPAAPTSAAKPSGKSAANPPVAKTPTARTAPDASPASKTAGKPDSVKKNESAKSKPAEDKGWNGKIRELNTGSFRSGIGSGVTLVDFWAPWCGPCRAQAPILEQVAKKLGNRAGIAKVNVDDNGTLSSEYKISGIPCMIIFKDGVEVERFVGTRPEGVLVDALEKWCGKR